MYKFYIKKYVEESYSKQLQFLQLMQVAYMRYNVYADDSRIPKGDN